MSIAVPQARPHTPSRTLRARVFRSRRVLLGGGMLAVLMFACVATLPWTLAEGGGLYFNLQNPSLARIGPGAVPAQWFGMDMLGRSLLARCLLGGAISLLIGLSAAAISVVLGCMVGLVAGYRGGWVDAVLMRSVDVLYGLPYVLLIVLLKIALERPLDFLVRSAWAANLIVLFLAIGLVSWLTMARVVRGQVLSLRQRPFIEAARAAGLPEIRIFLRHLLPNLIGPILVYATLIVPQAILQESFLSFLGIGINPPIPTWGNLASEALYPSLNPVNPRWWMLGFPCILLAVTLLCLNYLGDGLRDVFDPSHELARA